MALWDKRRATVVLVTHDVDEAIHRGDRVVGISPRPGRVKAEIAVNLGRPRTLAMRLRPAFAEVKRAIWDALGLAIG
jgi:ABC-type nitrate/sulfonate/bicarbonate transport system ATPase subunit